MVLKELIFNSFSLWKGCGSLERTDFNSFNLELENFFNSF